MPTGKRVEAKSSNGGFQKNVKIPKKAKTIFAVALSYNQQKRSMSGDDAQLPIYCRQPMKEQVTLV
jgi:predicted rRNA methylase YqxC with S4 and FtsJ domains